MQALKSISNDLFRTALPLTLVTLAGSAARLADRLFLGHYSQTALAAVSPAFTLTSATPVSSASPLRTCCASTASCLSKVVDVEGTGSGRFPYWHRMGKSPSGVGRIVHVPMAVGRMRSTLPPAAFLSPPIAFARSSAA